MAKRKLYPAPEQGIEREETKEEIEDDMEMGDKDEDVYTSEGREKLRDDDEVDDWEEGFMEGADGPGQRGKCMNCGNEILIDSCIEKEINGELKWFCSVNCLRSFERKHPERNSSKQ